MSICWKKFTREKKHGTINIFLLLFFTNIMITILRIIQLLEEEKKRIHAWCVWCNTRIEYELAGKVSVRKEWENPQSRRNNLRDFFCISNT